MDTFDVAGELAKVAESLKAADATDYQMAKFIKYFMSFYGRGGLTPIRNLTEADVRKGVKIRLENNPNIPWDGDTTDRELVRDVVLGWRDMEDEETKKQRNLGQLVSQLDRIHKELSKIDTEVLELVWQWRGSGEIGKGLEEMEQSVGAATKAVFQYHGKMHLRNR